MLVIKMMKLSNLYDLGLTENAICKSLGFKPYKKDELELIKRKVLATTSTYKLNDLDV